MNTNYLGHFQKSNVVRTRIEVNNRPTAILILLGVFLCLGSRAFAQAINLDSAYWVSGHTASPTSCVSFTDQQVTHTITFGAADPTQTLFSGYFDNGPSGSGTGCGAVQRVQAYSGPATTTVSTWCPVGVGSFLVNAFSSSCDADSHGGSDGGLAVSIDVIPMPWQLSIPLNVIAGAQGNAVIEFGYPTTPNVADGYNMFPFRPGIFFQSSNPDVLNWGFSSGTPIGSTLFAAGNGPVTSVPIWFQTVAGVADQDVTLSGCLESPLVSGCAGPTQSYTLHVGSDGSENLGPCDCEGEAGSPINVTTGNVWITEEDYKIPGLGGGIMINRTWNSLWPTTMTPSLTGMFGDSWRSNLEEQILTLGGFTKYIKADGSAVVFQHDSTFNTYTLISPPDAHLSLTFDSTLSQFTITSSDGTGRTFDHSGLLSATFDRNGNGISLTRDTSGRVTTVTDAGGRQITLSYGDPDNSSLVTAVQDSIGTIASYSYGSSGELLSVSYPDGSGAKYAYDSNLLMTSATDLQAKILETHTYDSSRRGLTSARAGGVDQVTLSYTTGAPQLTDSEGNVTTYGYQTIGRKNFVTSVNGPRCSSCGSAGTATFVYDGSGNHTSRTDALNRTINYTYDSNGNVLSQSQTVGGSTVTWSYTYNAFGEVLTATDPLQHTTTSTYDTKGNLLTRTTPSPGGKTAGSKTSYLYDSKGQPTQITDPLNNITKLAYTPAGLVSSVTDPLLKITSYTYDNRGNRTSVIDALNNQTTYQYDGRNRVTKITRPDLSTMVYAYDIRGRRTSLTDENSKTTQFAYDDGDRLVSVTDADNGITQFSYDTENNLTSITDALLSTTSFAYDSQRRLTQTTFPSTKTESYAYDAVGNLTSKTDRKLQTISYTYDELNRLTHKSYPDSTTISYTYDSASRLVQVQDPSGTYAFAYDNMDRLTQASTVYSVLPAKTFSVSYAYDAGSNRTGLTDPNGGSIAYSYDALNRLTTLKDFNRNSFTFGYDALSRKTSLARPNKVNTSYSYDALSNLVSVLHQNGTTIVDGATYVYDLAGNRASTTNRLNGIVSSYSYDNVYKMTATAQGASTTESYGYDAVGNRLSSLNVPSYTYNTSNELLSAGSAAYTYDDNGNTLTKADSTGTTTYSWDFENRLTAVRLPSGTTVNFKYDPLGRRIQKNTSLYIYDHSNLIQESDSAGNLLARYVHGPGIDQPLAAYRGSASEFYESDGLGSITSLSNTSGIVNQTYVFDSFGNLLSTTGTFIQPFRYTGREWDSETGLYYYRARYYDPVIGRFLSEDPIHFHGGMNFYSYVLDNPTNLSDPFGKQTNSVDSSMLQAIARGNSAEIEEILDDAGDVLSDRVKQAAREAIKKLRTKAKDWIAQKCKGSVNQEFPGEMREKTLEEIKSLAKGKGDLADKAKTAWKLLTDSRFQK